MDRRWWVPIVMSLAGWLIVGTWFTWTLAGIHEQEMNLGWLRSALFSFAAAIPLGLLPGAVLGGVVVLALNAIKRVRSPDSN
jgi:hypothetical protein